MRRKKGERKKAKKKGGPQWMGAEREGYKDREKGRREREFSPKSELERTSAITQS